MHPKKKNWLAINAVGGVAVLASYAHGIMTHPESRNALWGTIPAELQAIYGVTMWLAAAGYFFFSYYFVLRTDAEQVRFGRFGFGLINALYALIMVTSALWMPLTFAYLENPTPGLWLLVRVDLLLVAVGTIGLTIALFTMRPRAEGAAGVLALIGLLLFAVQTAFLDPIVWPQFF
ncbi:MAG: hypothetical protein KJO40_13750 [Deltaproteobacteria bacterium]|nr:hypothetical protein [Deltaproteobacteria bacterium]MBT8464428.1 hypothetical protein [Deltaproteobacteria bacterium]MBT8482767.1 hypothetical protein [Deltaproteobacteria bacterium]NNK41841.1 hypothetical protein [Myxococcales bacterium]NNL25628.1 hypothetical protein [Myxococcales bacterium]